MSAIADRRHLSSLTSLRAFGALLVFGAHSGTTLIPWDTSLSAHLTSQGPSGVSFFFILSGVVLTWSRAADRPSRQFYRRRFARLGPSYLVACALGVVVVLLQHPPMLADAVRDTLPSWVVLQAWVPSQAVYFGGNGVLWSLSCEAFFYALFPVINRRLDRLDRRQLPWLLGAAMAVTCLWPILLRPQGPGSVAEWAAYILPLYRLAEFVAGMAIGQLLLRGSRCRVPVWLAAALMLAAYVAAGWTPYWSKYTVIVAPFFALLIYAAASRDAAGDASVLHRATLVKLGEWSFAFYLLHQLVIKLADLYVATHGPTDTFLRTVATLVVSVAAAGVMFTYLERPLDRRIRGDGTLPASGA